MKRTLTAAPLLALALSGCAALSTTTPAHAEVSCDRYADIHGDDANPGTPGAPVQTLRGLVARLSAGQTGCLATGQRFVELDILPRGGSPGAPITIRSAPGASRASYQGQLWVQGTATDIVFTDLDFVGLPDHKKATSLIVHGDRITFRGNDITNPDGLCLNVGARKAYTAGDAGTRSDDVEIEGNRIYGCGTTAGVDRSDSGVHGVYLINSLRTVIRDNAIYDNADRGIQTWPSAQETLIEHNVLDGNGANLNIGSYAPNDYYSRGTVVRDNLITHSVLRALTDDDWPQGDTDQVLGNFPHDGVDYGNVVSGNCMWEPEAPGHQFSGWGFTQHDNPVVDPGYVDRAHKDFRLREGSPCAGKGPRVAPASAGTALSIARSASTVTVGAAVTISGRLTSDGAAVAGQPIDVYVRPAGSSVDYTWLDTVMTDADGRVSSVQRPRADAEYTLRFFAHDSYPSAPSGVLVVRVRRASISAVHAVSSTLNGEYVDVRNPGTVATSLSGWRLVDAASGASYSLPAVSVAPGAVLRVHTGSGTASAGQVYLGRARQVWRDGGGTVRLVTSAGATASTRSY